MSSLGTGVGYRPASGIDMEQPEPEIVLAIDSRGRVRGVALGNDVNLRDSKDAVRCCSARQGQQWLVRDRATHPPVRRALRNR